MGKETEELAMYDASGLGASPPCPSPEVLTDYAVGVLGRRKARETARHLRECLACAALAGNLFRLFTRLRWLHMHPWRAALRYLKGLLIAEDARAYERHIADGCASCPRALGMVHTLLSGVPAFVRQRLGFGQPEIAAGFATPAPEPASAAVRTSGAHGPEEQRIQLDLSTYICSIKPVLSSGALLLVMCIGLGGFAAHQRRAFAGAKGQIAYLHKAAEKDAETVRQQKEHIARLEDEMPPDRRATFVQVFATLDREYVEGLRSAEKERLKMQIKTTTGDMEAVKYRPEVGRNPALHDALARLYETLWWITGDLVYRREADEARTAAERLRRPSERGKRNAP